MIGSVRWLAILLTCCAVVFCNTIAGAANFPERPVRLIVGYTPGGATDVLARLIGRKLSEIWGQAVVVDNRPGAGGIMAADLVAHSPPDGYTILMITTNHTVPSNEYRNLNYDPIKSFAPITEIMYVPSILLVNPSVRVNSVKEFIELAKSKPGQLNFGSVGPGTAQFMDIQLFMNVAGIEMVNVSYKGGAPFVVALLSNEVQLTSAPITAYLVESVKAGKLKALAISGKVRSPLLPQVPTYLEAVELRGFEGNSNWYGIVAPAGASKEIVRKLHDDIVMAIKMPDVQRNMSDQGFVTVAGTPEEFTKRITNDLSKWSNLLRTMNIK